MVAARTTARHRLLLTRRIHSSLTSADGFHFSSLLSDPGNPIMIDNNIRLTAHLLDFIF
jgi:hypothetical protein